MESFCAERCQDLFSVLTLYHGSLAKKPGRNIWHTVIQAEKIKEHHSVHRKDKIQGKVVHKEDKLMLIFRHKLTPEQSKCVQNIF